MHNTYYAYQLREFDVIIKAYYARTLVIKIKMTTYTKYYSS